MLRTDLLPFRVQAGLSAYRPLVALGRHLISLSSGLSLQQTTFYIEDQVLRRYTKLWLAHSFLQDTVGILPAQLQPGSRADDPIKYLLNKLGGQLYNHISILVQNTARRRRKLLLSLGQWQNFHADVRWSVRGGSADATRPCRLPDPRRSSRRPSAAAYRMLSHFYSSTSCSNAFRAALGSSCMRRTR
jgi:hypothetical protein